MNTFDLRRFRQFLRFELLSRWKEWRVLVVAPPAILVFHWVVAYFRDLAPETVLAQAFKISLLLGAFMACQAHRREQEGAAAFHVLLPASTAERYLARWVITFLLPSLGQLALLTLLVNGLDGLGWLIQRDEFRLVWPEARPTLVALYLFAISHSFFFAGGVFFRGLRVIKTILAAGAYTAVVMGAVGVIGIIALFFGASGLQLADALESSSGYEARWDWVVIATFYAAAFFRAQETEVRA